MLTYQSDKLAAIAGMSKTLERLHQDRYIAGLWEIELPFSLYWARSESGAVADRLPFPTWSWASVACAVGIPLQIPVGTKMESMVSDIEVTIDGSTSECFFSDAQEGKLSLTGYVCSASYDEEQEPAAAVRLNAAGMETVMVLNRSGQNRQIISKVLAKFDGHPILGQPLPALLLFRRFMERPSGLIQGPIVEEFEHYLFLKPSPKPGYYERVGVGESFVDLDKWTPVEAPHQNPWYAGEEARRITIV
jgi:hypothetical protein